MRKITQAISAVCLLFALNSSAVALASSPSPLNPGTNVARLAEQAPIHWVSVAQIENSLAGRPPMAVGFDIDDTVLFSSPGFWRGKKTFSPESEDYLKNPVFWEKMNNGWDEFSIPKEVARQLIDMHVRRGDAIFFVTGRSPTKTETVSKTLADNFHIPATNMNPVIFAGDKPGQNTKSQWPECCFFNHTFILSLSCCKLIKRVLSRSSTCGIKRRSRLAPNLVGFIW